MEKQIKYYLDKLDYEIDSWDLYESLNRSENIVVVDARSQKAYAIRHIPGALNIPHRTMNKQTTSHLDKTALYVSYCDGIGCNGSTKGALNLAKLGFSVKELIGGLDWWLRDGYETQGDKATAGKEIVCGC